MSRMDSNNGNGWRAIHGGWMAGGAVGGAGLVGLGMAGRGVGKNANWLQNTAASAYNMGRSRAGFPSSMTTRDARTAYSKMAALPSIASKALSGGPSGNKFLNKAAAYFGRNKYAAIGAAAGAGLAAGGVVGAVADIPILGTAGMAAGGALLGHKYGGTRGAIGGGIVGGLLGWGT